MYIAFADDSVRDKPQRDGMGPLLAVGGIIVPVDQVRQLENALNDLCFETGFPDSEEIKWSPARRSWMRGNLRDKARENFQIAVLQAAKKHQATAIFVAEDTDCKPATKKFQSHEMDATVLFLERVNNFLKSRNAHGIVVLDTPGGGRSQETKFLAKCMRTIRTGTEYVKFGHLALTVTSKSELIRPLQTADLVVSCSLAHLAGHTNRTQKVFCEGILPLIDAKADNKKGGAGFKIHPDFKYVNLYYWLLGDNIHWHSGHPKCLPDETKPYSNSPDNYWMR